MTKEEKLIFKKYYRGIEYFYIRGFGWIEKIDPYMLIFFNIFTSDDLEYLIEQGILQYNYNGDCFVSEKGRMLFKILEL